MKKSTKKLLGALVIIIIFGMSSVVLIVNSSGFFNPSSEHDNQQPFKIDKYIFEEEIPDIKKSDIIQNQLTIVTATHKTGCCQDVIDYLKMLPDNFQNQVVVEILEGENNEIKATSLRGVFTGKLNTTQDIFPVVCRALIDAPPDCGVILISERNQSQ